MTDEPIRLLFVDMHTASRSALASMLDQQPNLTVVAEVDRIKDARDVLARCLVDVVLVDLQLPDGTCYELISSIQSIQPHTVAIVLTADETPMTRALTIAAGAVAMLPTTVDIPTITTAIEAACKGQPLISRSELVALMRLADAYLAQQQHARHLIRSLTIRERDVLQALAEGLDNRAIAERFNVGLETIRTHIGHILRKLDVNSRLHAVLLAVRYGWVNLDDSEDWWRPDDD